MEEHKTEKKDLFSRFGSYAIILVALLIVFNQFQIMSVSAMFSGGNTKFTLGSSSKGISLLSGKGGVIIGPQLNSDGKTTKLVEWPTISEMPKLKNTGNAQQDAIDYLVPTGTPWYLAEGPGADLGISFDDPITAQNIWGSLEGGRSGSTFKIELTQEEQARYDKITSVFTCDYCCGGPSSVTRITHCGCAHAFGWKGMARFFVKYYGDKYSDEEILGEMTRWKAAWYPKGMIQDYLVYTGQADSSILNHGGSVGIKAQFASDNTKSSASVEDLNNLPGMVGGC